jgi:tripartite ATP-independent transporter DctM subunit
MSSIEVGLAGIGALLLLLALRMPIGLSLIGVSFVGLWVLLGERPAWGMLRTVPYNFAANWTLSSVPMFLLMGFLCYHAGLTRGLFDAARAWLSRLPGGTAISALFGAAGFAAVTGSSVACAAAMGRMAIPEMLRQRYDPGLATGALAAAGTLGALIPPSILLIIYGIMANVQIGALFMGGLVIGLMSLLLWTALIIVRIVLNPALAPRTGESHGMAEKFRTLWDTWPIILLMLGVMGGLFSGVMTPTEAGATGAFLAFVIAFAKRTLTWAVFRDTLLETVITSTSIFIIAIGASLLARFIALSGLGQFLGGLVESADLAPLAVLLCILLFYIALGMFLEPIGGMLITLPVVLPIITGAGYDLLWFGIVLAKVLEIGLITPPIGLNVFVIKGVVGTQVSLATIFRGASWFIVADVVVIALAIAFPALITFLPSLM